jgi:hypothetical protein
MNRDQYLAAIRLWNDGRSINDITAILGLSTFQLEPLMSEIRQRLHRLILTNADPDHPIRVDEFVATHWQT